MFRRRSQELSVEGVKLVALHYTILYIHTGSLDPLRTVPSNILTNLLTVWNSEFSTFLSSYHNCILLSNGAVQCIAPTHDEQYKARSEGRRRRGGKLFLWLSTSTLWYTHHHHPSILSQSYHDNLSALHITAK